jgi:hypothetical protein
MVKIGGELPAGIYILKHTGLINNRKCTHPSFKKNCKRMTEVFILTKDSKGSTSRFCNPRNPSAKTQCTDRLRQKRN